MKNSSLLRKADLALADLTANGGLLQPEQSNTFIRKLLKTPTILPRVRVVSMAAPTRKLNKIGFGSRILRVAVSATALAPSDRAKPTTSQLSMDTDEVIAEVRLPYDVLEDNIESASAANNEASNTGPGGLRTTLISMIAERAALDLEELALGGDTASVDPYLALQNGFLKIASTSGNVVDYQNAAISKTLFKKGKFAMPDQYLRDIGSMANFVSVDQQTEYVDTLANRQTSLGDTMIANGGQPGAYGSPVVAVPTMGDTVGLFVNPKNLVFGVHRQISLEYDKDITARVYIIVLTARVGFMIEEPEAVVYYENIAPAV
jgi:HK97 family phage major capsid protein